MKLPFVSEMIAEFQLSWNGFVQNLSQRFQTLTRFRKFSDLQSELDAFSLDTARTRTSKIKMKKYHFSLSIATNSLWEALNVKARSPDKFIDVSDMQVSDEDGYMTRN